MKWTNDDVLKVEKLIEIRNKGYYCDGGQLTEIYNRVLEKNAPPTNCGSCMRQRISELETALSQFKKTLEVDNTPEENKVLTEAEIMKERMAKVRAAKKKK